MLQELTTRTMPERDRLTTWNAMSRRMIAPVEVRPVDATNFHGDMKWIQLKNCDLVWVSSDPASVFGGNEGRAPVLNLHIQKVGRSRHHYGSAAFELDEGDFVLSDCSRSIHTEMLDYDETLVLRLPLALALERLPKLRDRAGLAMKANAGPAKLFSRFICDAWDQINQVPGTWSETLEDIVWPLLELAYSVQDASTCEPTIREQRRRAIFKMLEDNLCDPDLDIHQIAKHVGVSPRYIQILFAEIATTPMAYVKSRRLDLASDRLKQYGTGCSITDLAFDVGFGDLSLFCRDFRKRFQVTPSQYRSGLRSPTAVRTS